MKQKRSRGILERRHITAEADRVIASNQASSEMVAGEVRQGTATLEKRFDRLEAMVSSGASSSSGRDDLLQRLAGKPGSSKETQAVIDANKELKKRQLKEEREEEKKAEKRRKAMEPFEIPLEEGDSRQDGVVVRAGAERRLCDYKADEPFDFHGVTCRLVEMGNHGARLQLEPCNATQLKALQTLPRHPRTGKSLFEQLQAVTKHGAVAAQLVDGKVKEAANQKNITAALLGLRFRAQYFNPVEFLRLKREARPAATTAEEPVRSHEVEQVAEPAWSPQELDQESTVASSGLAKPAEPEEPLGELHELDLNGEKLRFTVVGVFGRSPIGPRRTLKPQTGSATGSR